MKIFQQLLKELRACSEAREWAGDKTIEEVVETCDRGDWLLWLASRVNVDDRKLTLAKGLCANTVRHLMKDKRSIDAVDTAIAYGKWEVGIEALNAAASVVAASASVVASYAASSASYAAASASYAASSAAYAASSAASSADSADSARKENQMQTANICREVIGQEIIEKVNKMLN